MSLLNRLRADHLAARKANDSVRKGLLTALIGEAQMVGKNNGNRESTDAEVIGMVRKFIKNAEETKRVLPEAIKHTAQAEIDILVGYLPQQMDESQLREVIYQFRIANPHAKIGDAMKFLKERYEGQYDGKIASTAVKSVLG